MEKYKNFQFPVKENKQKGTKIIININDFYDEDINNELKRTRINKINIKKLNDIKPKNNDNKENNAKNKEKINNSELKNKIDNILNSEKLDLSL